ncbi:MAG: hypothetical protein ACM3N7_03350 [Planctomycetaceae bacterium]
MKADVVFLIFSRSLEPKILCVGRRRNGVKSVFLGKESVFCVGPNLPGKRLGGRRLGPSWRGRCPLIPRTFFSPPAPYPAELNKRSLPHLSSVFPALEIGIMGGKDCLPGL